MKKSNIYKYKAKVLDVYDADTMTLLIDVGFNIYIKEKCRLHAIDTPELRTRNKKEKELGYEARDYVRGLILGKEIIIETIKEHKKGKFGRYLFSAKLNNGKSLAKHLISKGYGKPYFGGKKVGCDEN